MKLWNQQMSYHKHPNTVLQIIRFHDKTWKLEAHLPATVPREQYVKCLICLRLYNPNVKVKDMGIIDFPMKTTYLSVVSS